MKIILDLSEHCIETAVKKELKKFLTRLLNQTIPDQSDSEAYEFLKQFSEQADFSFLRASFQELRGGADVKIILTKP